MTIMPCSFCRREPCTCRVGVGPIRLAGPNRSLQTTSKPYVLMLSRDEAHRLPEALLCGAGWLAEVVGERDEAVVLLREIAARVTRLNTSSEAGES